MITTVTDEGKECLITGDLNCNYLKPNDHVDIKDIFATNGFKQMIKEATRTTSISKTLIDIFLTTDSTKISKSFVDANSISDHDLVGIVRKMHVKKYASRKLFTRDYSKYNKDHFKDELRNVPWKNCFVEDNMNSSWNLFKHYLTIVINKHAPLVERKIRGMQNPWMSRDIKTKMNTRDYYLRCAKRTNSENDWSSYRRVRNLVSYLIRQAKANHIRSLFRENGTSPKDFWKQIKKSYPVKNNESASRSFKIGNETITDKKLIADGFCHFFATVGSTLVNSIPSITNLTWLPFNGSFYLTNVNPQHLSFKFQHVEISETIKMLKEINSSKASGIDDLPALLIKDAAEELAAPLSFLINHSFKSGIFPTIEKTAKVTPIYKSEAKHLFSNYRPISVLNVISKVVEKIAFDQLSQYFESNGLFSPYQYGFRKKRSTQHAVTNLVNHIRNNMDKGNKTGVLYMDFSKAFDTVNHSCLLHKLPYYGITENELSWISDYLFNRSQLVNFEGTSSRTESITHGVPQGSILGPLLFIILLNDLHFRLKNCSILKYADDTVLYYSHKNERHIVSVINKEADVVQSWIRDNCLILNMKKGKTEFVMYRNRLSNVDDCNVEILSTTINQSDTYEYLGITLDSHLNLNEHYSKVYKKICSRIYLLKKLRHQISPVVANSIYNALIKPIFHYCYPVYCNQSNSWKMKFEGLHNRANTIIHNTGEHSISIENERKRKAVTDVFKILHKIDNVSNIQYELVNHNINTRGNKSQIRLPKVRTEAGRKTTSYYGAQLFNTLNLDVRNEKSFVNFKRYISKHEW